jgi:ABC-2 type transport system permease protein
MRKKTIKMGLYSIVMSVIAIAIVIGINLFVGSLPSSKTKFDTTPDEIYSLSDQSKKIAANIQDDVTIYLLSAETSKDNSLYEFLERYAAENDHIKVTTKDPVLYPNFASDYTDEDVSSNSVLIVNGTRGKYISYDDIYVSSYSMNYTTYSYDTSYSFDGENCITSALDYVTSDNLPIVYVLTGHGEESLTDYSSEITGTITDENITLEDLSLLKEGAVPEDATAVLIFAPSTDLSDDELEMLRTYEQASGKIYMLTDFMDASLTNFKALLADFGMEVVDGVIVEGNKQYYYQYPTYLLPDFLSHEITDPLSGNYYVLIGNTQAVQEIEDAGDEISVTPLLETSDEAYCKVDGYNITTYEKESNDTDGSFYLAACSVLTGDDYTAQMVYIPSTMFLNDQVNQLMSGANHDFFLNALEWLCDREDTISIRAKSLDVEYLTVTEQTARNWEVILMGIIPVGLLIFGGMVIYKRKNKKAVSQFE